MAKEEEISKAKLDVTRTNRELEESKKKILAVEKSREELQSDRTKYKLEVVELKKTIRSSLQHNFFPFAKKL